MSGWMWFVIALVALVILDKGISNVCNTFGTRARKDRG